MKDAQIAALKEELRHLKEELRVENAQRQMDRAAQLEEESLAARARHDDLKKDLSEIFRSAAEAIEEQKQRLGTYLTEMTECADDLSTLKKEGAFKADIDLAVEQMQRQKGS
ncbi:hypothetical protein BDZ89DRAFT_1153080 [Hymenopellis radicata]|nr:hypothetical protein BDZ89DRAFT_1153080 [Hymenopellis radicata]